MIVSGQLGLRDGSIVEGGVKVVQSATVVVSLPLLAVGVLLALSILRMIREDEAAGRL